MAIDERLKLHMNGVDGSTTFTDDSPQEHTTASVVATCELDTAEKQWGSASVLLNGDSGYFTYVDSPDWDINGSNEGSWCLDFWVKHDGFTTWQMYVAQVEDTNNAWYLRLWYGDPGGIVFYQLKDGGGLVDTTYGGPITDSDWHHIALIRVGNDIGIYLDGQQVAHSIDDNDTDTLNGTLRIGYGESGDPQYLDGWMDEIRINHSNPFNAAPNVDDTDTIPVPGAEDSYEAVVDNAVFFGAAF